MYNQDLTVDKAHEQATFISKVYAWMAAALLITGFVAMATAANEEMMAVLLGNQFLYFGLLIGEVAMVWYLAARIHTLSSQTATYLFVAYSVLNGITLSLIFHVYTQSSIATTFLITAGTFTAMSAYGFYTKKDLTSMGRILTMALIGIIIASVVNMFVESTMTAKIINYVGVLVFVGLTAYDTQKIKEIYAGEAGTEDFKKLSIMGALTLYLDFINLFLLLLRILGGRRDD
ncbi:MAG: Bax inhibitor-1/YccA family protein [Bacteroidetes bacterium]|nr:Bax inhibitor-1/YccA family protein [Bacteroidota bacterium]